MKIQFYKNILVTILIISIATGIVLGLFTPNKIKDCTKVPPDCDPNCEMCLCLDFSQFLCASWNFIDTHFWIQLISSIFVLTILINGLVIIWTPTLKPREQYDKK